MSQIQDITKNVDGRQIHIYGASADLLRWSEQSGLAKTAFASIPDYGNHLAKALGRWDTSQQILAATSLVKALWCKYPELGPCVLGETLAQFQFDRQFYSNYRDHVVHQIKVFLLGLFVFENCPMVKEAIHQEIGAVSESAPQEIFLKRWLLAATFHDVGYVLENEKASDPQGGTWLRTKKELDQVLATPLAFVGCFRDLLPDYVEQEICQRNNISPVLALSPQHLGKFRNMPLFHHMNPEGIRSGLAADPAGSPPVELYYNFALANDPDSKLRPRFHDHGVVSALILLQIWRAFQERVQKFSALEDEPLLTCVRKQVKSLSGQLDVEFDNVRAAAAAMALHNVNKDIWVGLKPNALGCGLTLDQFCIRLIGDGIEPPIGATPLAFLLAFCDTLQDWDRPIFRAAMASDHFLYDDDISIDAKDGRIRLFFRQDHSRFMKPSTEDSSLFNNAKSALKAYLEPNIIEQLVVWRDDDLPRVRNQNDQPAITSDHGSQQQGFTGGQVIKVEDYYSERIEVLKMFREFTAGSQVCLNLIGGSGCGKSQFLGARTFEAAQAGRPAAYVNLEGCLGMHDRPQALVVAVRLGVERWIQGLKRQRLDELSSDLQAYEGQMEKLEPSSFKTTVTIVRSETSYSIVPTELVEKFTLQPGQEFSDNIGQELLSGQLGSGLALPSHGQSQDLNQQFAPSLSLPIQSFSSGSPILPMTSLRIPQFGEQKVVSKEYRREIVQEQSPEIAIKISEAYGQARKCASEALHHLADCIPNGTLLCFDTMEAVTPNNMALLVEAFLNPLADREVKVLFASRIELSGSFTRCGLMSLEERTFPFEMTTSEATFAFDKLGIKSPEPMKVALDHLRYPLFVGFAAKLKVSEQGLTELGHDLVPGMLVDALDSKTLNRLLERTPDPLLKALHRQGCVLRFLDRDALGAVLGQPISEDVYRALLDNSVVTRSGRFPGKHEFHPYLRELFHTLLSTEAPADWIELHRSANAHYAKLSHEGGSDAAQKQTHARIESLYHLCPCETPRWWNEFLKAYAESINAGDEGVCKQMVDSVTAEPLFGSVITRYNAQLQVLGNCASALEVRNFEGLIPGFDILSRLRPDLGQIKASTLASICRAKAMIRLRANRLQSAEEELAKARQYEPEHENQFRLELECQLKHSGNDARRFIEEKAASCSTPVDHLINAIVKFAREEKAWAWAENVIRRLLDRFGKQQEAVESIVVALSAVLESQGKIRSAVEVLEAAIRQGDAKGNLKLTLGRMHVEAGRRQEGHALIAVVAQELESPTGSAEEDAIRLDKAGELWLNDMKDAEQAQRAYEGSFAADPSRLSPLFGLNRLWVKARRWDQAREVCRRMAEECTDSQAEVQGDLARAYVEARAGDMSAAEQYCQTAAKNPAEVVTGMIAVAGRAEQDEAWVAALALYWRLGEMEHDQRAGAWERAGDLCRDELKDVERARQAYEASFAADPSRMSPLFGLSRLWVKAGRWDEAREACRRMAEECTDAQATVQGNLARADVEARAGDMQAAERYCRAAAKDDEEVVGAMIGVADRAEKDEAWAGAAGLYLRLAELSPNQMTAAKVKAVQCYLKAGNRPQAEEITARSGDNAELAVVWAQFCGEAEDWKGAAYWHGQVAALLPQHQAVALEHVADIQRDHLQDVGAAARAYEASFADDQSRTGPLHGLSRLWVKAGRWDEAREACRRMAEECTDAQATAQGNLARAYVEARAGDMQAAERYCRATAKDEEEIVGGMIGVADRAEKDEAWACAGDLHLQVSELSPSLSSAAKVKAVMCYLKAGNRPQAEEITAKIGNNAELAVVWAQFCGEAEDWKGAAYWHGQVAELLPQHRAVALEHVADIQRDHLQDVGAAARAYEASFAADQSRTGPLHGLSRLWAKASRWDEAREACRRMAEECTDAQATAQGNLARAYVEARAGDMQAAERYCRAAAKDEEEIVGGMIGVADRAEKDEAWAGAAGLYLRLAELSPSQVTAAKAMAVMCYLKAGNRPQAEEITARIGDNAELAVVWAQFCGEAEDWKGGAYWYGQVAELLPQHRAVALEHVADIQRDHLQDFGAAARAYEASFAADPSRMSPLFGLSRLWVKAGRWDEAREACRRMAEECTGAQATAQGNLARAYVEARAGDMQAAERYCRAAAKDEEEVVGGMIGVADRAEKDEAWACAGDLHLQVSELSPSLSSAAKVKAVICYLKAENRPQAEEITAKIGNNAELAVVWAQFCDEANDWKGAVYWHGQVEELSPQHRAVALEHVADIQRDHLQDVGAAVRAYEASFAADPSRMSPLFGLSRLWVKVGRWDEAREACRRMAEECTDAQATVQGNLARAYVEARAGDMQAAERYCRAAAKDEEEVVGGMIGVADRAEKDEAWAGAADLYLRLAELSPSQVTAAKAKAVQCLFKSGSLEAAERMASADDSPVEALIGLADAYTEVGHFDVSTQWWRRVVSKDRNPSNLIGLAKVVIATFGWAHSQQQQEISELIAEIVSNISPLADQGDLTAIRRLAWVWLIQGKIEKAVRTSLGFRSRFEEMDARRADESIMVGSLLASDPKEAIDARERIEGLASAFEDRVLLPSFTKNLAKHLTSTVTAEGIDAFFDRPFWKAKPEP